jgi:hypothetical protein
MPKKESTIKAAELLASGYTRSWHQSYATFHPEAKALFQKCVYDGDVKKYFIDIWQYDFNEVPNAPFTLLYGPEVQFTLPSGMTLSVSLHAGPDTTLAEVETTCEQIFQTLRCRNYEG